jgi:hypothetical protein
MNGEEKARKEAETEERRDERKEDEEKSGSNDGKGIEKKALSAEVIS